MAGLIRSPRAPISVHATTVLCKPRILGQGGTQIGRSRDDVSMVRSVIPPIAEIDPERLNPSHASRVSTSRNWTILQGTWASKRSLSFPAKRRAGAAIKHPRQYTPRKDAEARDVL